jgi:hypothetical protein
MPITKKVPETHRKQITIYSADKRVNGIEAADELFAEVIKLKEKMPTLAAFSNERIFAEGDYNKALPELLSRKAAAQYLGS